MEGLGLGLGWVGGGGKGGEERECERAVGVVGGAGWEVRQGRKRVDGGSCRAESLLG